MPEQDLLELKKAVDKAKNEESQLVGQKTQLLKTLKEDFNCNDVEEGKKYLADILLKIKEKDKDLTSGVEKLKGELVW